MENTNADAQLEVAAQEELTFQEESVFEDHSEETVTIPKSKFNQIRRKAVAYDANKEGQQTKNINNSASSTDDAWKARMELKVEGYNDDEIKLIMRNGGKESLKDPYITSAIEAVRTQKGAETAMLGSEGQKSSVIGGLSQQDFSKLTAEQQLAKLSEL